MAARYLFVSFFSVIHTHDRKCISGRIFCRGYHKSQLRMGPRRSPSRIWLIYMDDIVEKIRPAIVAILKEGRPDGTGFLATSDGHVITAYHVIQGLPRDRIIVEMYNGEQLPAKLIENYSRDEKYLDFAILKIDNKKTCCLPLGTDFKQDDPWTTIGYELLKTYKDQPHTGKIIGRAKRSDENIYFINLVADKPMKGGMSGSPLFNKKNNRVVGVIEESRDHEAMALPIENIYEIWPELRDLNSLSDLRIDIPIGPSRSSSSLIPRQIPLPPADFTGRDKELQSLESSLKPGSSGLSLHGMGGVGKTALAFALAERIKERFPDGNLFINMQGTSAKPLMAAESMAQVIRSYDSALPLPESDAEIANTYRSVLDGKCALLLFDNAFDDKHVRPLMPPAKCCVIVTSRRKFKLPGLASKDLEVLKLEKAIELLLKMAGLDSSNVLPQKMKAWKELAQLCGCLPVALRAAGSFLANTPDSSPEQYVKELQDERKRLKRIGNEGVEEDVDLKLSLSYKRLPPETASVFRILSIFPGDFDALAEEAVCLDEGHRHLSELVRWSLVEYQRQESKEEGRYHLHDLVKLFAAARLENKDGNAAIVAARLRYASHYQGVLWEANDLLLKGGKTFQLGLEFLDLDWINIQSGQAWAESNSTVSSKIAEICSDYAWAGSILSLRLHPRDYVNWLNAALVAARQIKDRNAEGAHLGNLGLAYAALGDAKKAIKFYEQHLVIAREIGDSRGEGTALFNLSLSLNKLGQRAEAIESARSALKIFEQIESPYAERVRQQLAEWQK